LPAAARNADRAWALDEQVLFYLSTILAHSSIKISPRNVADVQQGMSLKGDAVRNVQPLFGNLHKYRIDPYPH